MARAGIRSHDSSRGLIFRQQAFGAIEMINDHAIHAEICDEREFFIGTQIRSMRVRRFLAFFVWAGADVLVKGTGRCQAAIVLDRQAGHASAAVV